MISLQNAQKVIKILRQRNWTPEYLLSYIKLMRQHPLNGKQLDRIAHKLSLTYLEKLITAANTEPTIKKLEKNLGHYSAGSACYVEAVDNLNIISPLIPKFKLRKLFSNKTIRKPYIWNYKSTYGAPLK